jgi:ADP-ribose pyrophosphatase YjhB (NUDIX family)
MNFEYSHCSFCGAKQQRLEWPRQCTQCGNRTYLNPIPVVVALVPIDNGLIVIRRNTEPQKGTLTFPGGYIDSGESWQKAAERELLEETGIHIEAKDFCLYDVMNGLDNTIVVFGLGPEQPLEALQPFQSDETQEVLTIKGPMELGFPNHTEVASCYFAK